MERLRRPATSLALLAAVIIVGAFVADPPGPNAKHAATSTASRLNLEVESRWTTRDIVRALHLRDEDPEHPGVSYVTPSGIHISDVLTNANAVDSYPRASDRVASNPAGDAGVIFRPYDSFKGSNEDAAAEVAGGLAALYYNAAPPLVR